MTSRESKGSTRWRAVKYVDDEEALRLEYEDSRETINDHNIIAAIEAKDPIGPGGQHIILHVLQSESKYSLDCLPTLGLPPSFLERHLQPSRPCHLSPFQCGRGPFLYVVVSTRAGVGQAHDFFSNVVRPALAAYGYQDKDYCVHSSTSESSINRLAQEILPNAQSSLEQTILFLSGDGAIVDFVNVFQSRDINATSERYFVRPIIGLIALGTGNALANSTGINSDGTLGLRHFFRGTPRQLPTFIAKFSPGSEYIVDEGRSTEPLPIISGDDECGVVYGAVVCSWGLHASLVADSDTTEYRKFGSERFQMAAKELLAPSDGSAAHVYKGRVTLLGDKSGALDAIKLEREEHAYVLATLVSNLEQKLKISPHSKPLDGQLRLLHFGPMSSEKVMEILGKAFMDGSHIHDDAVGYTGIEGLRIDFDEEDSRWRRVCVDGKIVAVGKKGWVEVRMCEKPCLDLLTM